MSGAEHESLSHVTLMDVLDRVLAKGIVISYDVDVSVAGLRVIGFVGMTTIMSLETYTKRVGAQAGGEATTALISAAEQYLRDLPGDAPNLNPH